MIPLTAEEAGRALGLGPLAAPVTGVSIDSRTLRAGDLFVALRGEIHDGHDHLKEALDRRAGAAVVRLGFTAPADLPSRPLYHVPDTGAALGALGAAVRTKGRAQVIGVTGSVGKTTTKDILRTMASVAGSVTYTQANQNNEVGVPLTLLAMTDTDRVAVVEMGMRGLGQVALLSSWARPDVALITKVAPVHLELLGDLEKVARAKAEILSGLAPGGVGVIPWQAPFLEAEVATVNHPLMRFGFGPGEEAADVWGTLSSGGGERRLRVRWPEGEAEVALPWASRHRFENAVGALAAVYAAGLDVGACLDVLPETVFTPLRGDETLVRGLLVLDDTYNANPQAMRTALDTLRDRAVEMGGRAVAVLGDMRELGEGSQGYHREVGLYAAESGVDLLWGVGQESRAMVDAYLSHPSLEGEARSLPLLPAEQEEVRLLAEELTLELKVNDVVLFKASRGVQLDRLVQELRGLLAATSDLPSRTSARSQPTARPGA
jgi:UDP-N-acetylmuramoyl-tripeptide--D-alanyl-D-alanine ligase